MKNRNHNESKILDKHKKMFAIKRGYNSWNEFRLNNRLQDAFRDLHEVAINAIDELESKIKHLESMMP